MDTLPTGVVTFLFTDIEGSTRLIRNEPSVYPALLARHREIVRDACLAGVEFGTAGDALFFAFEQPDWALMAAADAQRRLAAEKWQNVAGPRVRMGLSAGSVELQGTDYVGLEVHRVARICAAAHGGQVVVSHTVKDLATGRFSYADLGEYALAGLAAPERLYQLQIDGLPVEFPALRADHGSQRRRERQPTLGDAARRVRRILPAVDDEVRGPLNELAARLFTGERAADYADTFLARVDHRRLAKRLDQHREMAAHSPVARRAADTIQAQIDRVAAVQVCRAALDDATTDIPGLLAQPSAISTPRVADIEARVSERMAALDEAVIQAVMTVDPLAYKLKRTLHRGVYRDGKDYVVPHVNHLGIDSLRSFDSEREARDFHEAVRIAERSQREYRSYPPDYPISS